jgi:hypothetical protein
MHEETFDKLLWDVEKAELAWTMEMRKQAEALLDRYQR